MRKFGLLLFFVLFCSAMYAQQFRISSFNNLPSDNLKIRPDLYPKDCKGALIIISTSEGYPSDYIFQTSSKIIQLRIVENIIFLVVPNKTKTITIKHRDFGVIKDYEFPEKIKSNKVYQLGLYAKRKIKYNQGDRPAFKTEIDPEFMGCRNMQESNNAFRKWVTERIQYPKIAERDKITGTVYVKFIIDKSGSIRNCEILGNPHWELADEAIRVLLSSPKWMPGTQEGKPVNVHGTIRIVFSL